MRKKSPHISSMENGLTKLFVVKKRKKDGDDAYDRGQRSEAVSTSESVIKSGFDHYSIRHVRINEFQ